MADKEVHHYSSGDGGGGSGIGAFLGIIVGAVLVVGLLYVFANNWDGGSNVSVNVPAAPSAPSAPAPSAPSTSGSAPSR